MGSSEGKTHESDVSSRATVTRVATEDPQRDQWRMLSQYGYPENVKKYLRDIGKENWDSELPEFVAGCINQGHSYFQAAAGSRLDISPLLLYYGVSNVMLAVATLLSAEKRQINHHGLKLKDANDGNTTRIADVSMRPCNEKDGAMQLFLDAFAPGNRVSSLGEWSVEELIGSIPDLRDEYERCYDIAIPYTIPAIVGEMEVNYRDKNKTQHTVLFETIHHQALARYENPHATLATVKDFNKFYLPLPSFTINGAKDFQLYRRMHVGETGVYTIYGTKFLELPHVKNGSNIYLSQFVILFMTLYALGTISRYRPQKWNLFVQSDTTGERLVVERFLSIAERYIPNLALNYLMGSDIEFYHPGIVTKHDRFSVGI